MFRSGRIALCSFFMASMFCVTSVFAAEKPKPAPPAPIPVQILSARTIFISNAAIEDPFLRSEITRFTGSGNGFYDQFYDAIKTWGRYDMVPAPADADLVLEISLNWEQQVINPRLQLRILDPKTRVVLWGFSEGSERNSKNWDKALAALVNDLKTLTAPTPSPVSK